MAKHKPMSKEREAIEKAFQKGASSLNDPLFVVSLASMITKRLKNDGKDLLILGEFPEIYPYARHMTPATWQALADSQGESFAGFLAVISSEMDDDQRWALIKMLMARLQNPFDGVRALPYLPQSTEGINEFISQFIYSQSPIHPSNETVDSAKGQINFLWWVAAILERVGNEKSLHKMFKNMQLPVLKIIKKVATEAIEKREKGSN